MTAGKGHIVLAAGGTGGHMFPAHALAEELKARGYSVGLITDQRGLGYPGLFPGIEPKVVKAASPSRGGVLGPLKTYFAVRKGRAAAKRLFKARRPLAVIGFGGYPPLPAILAAFSLKIPVVIHEQNAVLGRVNRLVAGRADAIAVSYERTELLRQSWRNKTALTGNPVRPEIIALRDQGYPHLSKDGVLRLLVIGGSQGARALSQVVPEAVKLLPPGMMRRLQIVQQCRPEDIEHVRRIYSEQNVPAEVMTFIEDLPARLAWAHLVISRAGASSLAELAVAGRPSILVPLPGAMDDHQNVNAESLLEKRGAVRIVEQDFTPIALAKHLQRLATQPEELAAMAAGARAAGQPKAAAVLADLVEHIAKAPKGRSFAEQVVKGAEAGKVAI